MNMADPHPFTRALLRKAVRELLKDRHDHSTPVELTSCVTCMDRFWGCLGRAAPKGVLGHGK